MAVNHDAVAALPITSAASQTLVRNVLTARMPYVLADTDTPTNLIAVDPATGAAIVDIVFLGRVFHYDPTDTTTANDGVSCLVSNEGRRYKLAQGTDVFAYAVLNNTISVPPGTPLNGDAYLVATGGTGAWAGKDGQIAVRTKRGWEFINFGIGRLIYVESVEAYYHKTSLGVWAAGLGNFTIGAQSLPFSAAINFGATFRVENQTTTAPPGSPTLGTAYIIGPSATGAWLGLDGRVAVCELAGSFTIYAPANGWNAYDKSLNSFFTFNGSAWASTAGTWVRRTSVQTGSGSTANNALTLSYTYSNSTPPTKSQRALADSVGLSYTAKKTGAVLRIHYSADVTYSAGSGGVGAGDLVIAVYRDAVSNAVDWQRIPIIQAVALANSIIVTHLDHWFEIAAPDAAAHSYAISLHSTWTAANNVIDPSNLVRRTLSIEESA